MTTHDKSICCQDRAYLRCNNYHFQTKHNSYFARFFFRKKMEEEKDKEQHTKLNIFHFVLVWNLTTDDLNRLQSFCCVKDNFYDGKIKGRRQRQEERDGEEECEQTVSNIQPLSIHSYYMSHHIHVSLEFSCKILLPLESFFLSLQSVAIIVEPKWKRREEKSQR